MTAIITSNGLGLSNSLLGAAGGNAALGRAGESVYVNGSSGNLVVQRQDELLLGAGLDLGVLRTYNSQGQFDGDNNDQWRIGLYRSLGQLSGTINTAGSSIVRTNGDGAELKYTYDSARGLYINTDGAGSFDSLSYSGSTWTWTDGDSRVTESYDWNGSSGKLLQLADTDGNALTYSYTGSLLTMVTDASGEKTYLDYSGTNLTQIRTVKSDASTVTRTRYTYDASNRLTQVTTDLSPDDYSIVDNNTYVTTYTYDGTSKRIASIGQTDGSSVSFGYTLINGSWRVTSVTDALGHVTGYSYTDNTTSSGTQSANANNGVLSTTSTDTSPLTGTLSVSDSSALSGTLSTSDTKALVGTLSTSDSSALSGTLGTSDAKPLIGTLSTTDTSNLNNAALTTPAVSWGTAALRDTQTTAASKPQVTYDQNGNGMAVWAQSTELYFSLYNKNTDSWSAPATLEGSLPNAPTLPHLSMSANGNALVTWVQNSSIYARRYISGAWDSATSIPVLENVTNTATNPVGAINDAGRAIVVFTQTDNTRYNLFANVFTGTAWQSTATNLDDKSTINNNGISIAPSIAIDAQNNATVLWLQKTGTQGIESLYLTRYTASSNSWANASGTSLETDNTNGVAAAQMAFDSNGNGLVTWLQGSTTARNLYARAYTKSTNTWAAATTLSTVAIIATDSPPSLSMSSNGNALVTWVQGSNLVARRYAAGAWIGTTPTALESLPGKAYNPVAAINNAGQAAVVFVQDGGSGQYNVYAARYAGSAWTAASVIETNSNIVGQTATDVPSVAIDASGNINTVWLQKNGTEGNNSVYSNHFNAVATPYYTIPTSPTWAAIAQAVYGVPAGKAASAGAALQTALNNPALIAGNRLTGFPPTLTYAVPAYYTIPNGATWIGITQTLYGTSDANAASALQSQQNNVALIAGNRLVGLPASLSYTVAPYYTIPANPTWSAIAQTLYGVSAGNAASAGAALQSVLNNPALIAGNRLTGLPANLTYTVPAYYTIPNGATWAGITQTLYGTSAASAASALQSQQNNVALIAGNRLVNLPANLSYTVAPYYTIPANPTWSGIAQTLYGVSAGNAASAGSALQTVLNNPALIAGNRLTGFPPTLTYTVPAYFTIPNGATWASITQTLYGTSDANAASALQTQQGNPALTAGNRLTGLPGSLSYATTVAPYYTVQTGDTWASIAQAVYGVSASNAASAGTALQTALSPATLTSGVKLNVPATLSYTGSIVTSVTLRMTDALGNQTVFTSDSKGQLTNITGPAVAGVSQSISYTYSTTGDIASQTDARGNLISYSYDSNGNQTLQRDAAGNTITRTYGSKNELLTETIYLVPDPDGAGAAQPGVPLTTRYAYDANNHLRFTVSAEGRVGEYRYNAQGQAVSSIGYTDAVYNVTGLAATVSLSETTLATWAATADKTRSLRVDMTYDFRGQVAGSTRYAKVDATGNGIADGSQATTTYVYDQAGNLLSTVAPKGVATTADATDFITRYVYDGLGRVLSTTDSLGRITQTNYDDAHHKTVTTLANGLVTTSLYNTAGDLISLLQSDGAQALGTTSYFFDADDRLRMTQDPTGVKNYGLYDEAGRKVAGIEADGSLHEYLYNANNQLIKTISYATAVSAANLTALTNDSSAGTNSVTLASIRPATTANDRSVWNLYDNANRLVKSIDEEGYVTQSFYDGAGRITDTIRYATAVNTAGITTSTQASDAVVTPVASGNDRHTRTFFDADGKALATLDAAGYLTENQYDAAGRLVHSIGYATQTNSSFWNNGTLAQLRPLASTQDIHGALLYDGRGNVIAAVNGEGYLTESIYDLNGNQTQQIAYANKALIAPQNISANALIGSLRPASTPQDQVSSQTYTQLNQLQTSTNSQGTVTRYSYDSVGNLIQTDLAWGTSELRTLQARYDKQGRLTGELSAEGSAALAALSSPTQAQIDALWNSYGLSHSYDAAGRRISTVDANGNKTRFYFNLDGQLTVTINALGEVTESKTNALNQVTQTIAYGTRINSATLATLNGGLVDSLLSNALTSIANSSLDSKQTLAYTQRGQLAASTDALGNTNSQSYNAFGQVSTSTTKIDAGTNVITGNNYDNRGLLIQTQQDASGINRITSAIYDAFGRTTQTTDASGNQISIAYDRLGRTIQTTDALNVNRSSSYDAFSRVLTQTDGLGNITNTSYDTANRSITITTAEGISLTSATDRHGETVSVTDGSNNTSASTYDRNGNLRSSTDVLGHSSTSNYDHANRLIETIDANGTHTTYQYDAANRLLSRTLDPTGLNLTTSYGTDAKGQTVSVTDANGVVTQTTYDLKGQVTQVAVDPTGLNLRTIYTYDARGKTLTVTEGAGTAAARTTQYTYDKLGRRTQENIDPAGLNITTGYGYDKNDNPISKTDALNNVTRYFYDANNQLIYTLDAQNGVTQNTYDADGKVVKVTAYTNPITGLSANPTTAEIASKITSSASDHIQQSVYDKDGRTVFGIDSLNQVTQNQYDANGNVVKTVAYANPITLPGTITVATVTAALNPSSNDHSTRTVYDAANRAVYSIDALGFVKETQYDNGGQISKTIQYATAITPIENATVTQMQSALAAIADAAKDQVNTFTYDHASRLSNSVDAEGYSESYQYDAVGNKIAFTNKKGATWTYQYDTNRRLTREITPQVEVTSVTTADAPAIAGGWSGVQLLETQSTYINGNHRPGVAYDTQGNAMATWVQADGSGYMRLWAAYAPAGQGWSAPVMVNSTGEVDGSSPQQIAFDAQGNAISVWLQFDGSRTDVWANRYVKGSGWQGAQLLETQNIANAQQPKLAIDGQGNATVGWFQSDGTRGDIYVARYTAGQGWNAPQIIDTGTGDATQVSLVGNAQGNLFAVWTQHDGSYYSIRSARYIPGQGWGAPVVLEGMTRNAWIPVVAVNASGDAVAVWPQDDGAVYDVYAARFSVASGIWSAPSLANSGSDYGYEPQVVLDDAGVATLAWQQLGGGQFSIWSNRQRADGSWEGARLMEQGSGEAALTGMALGGNGDVVLTWHQFGGYVWDAWAVRYQAATGWGTAEVLEQDGYYSASYPAVALDAQGNAQFVWAQGTAAGGGNSIYVGRYTVPQLASHTTTASVVQAAIETRIQYDALGSVIARTEAYGRPEARTTSYVYDVAGNQVQTIFPQVGVYAANSDVLVNYVGRNETTVTPTSTTWYDALGRAYASKDVRGSFSYKVYDSLGRVQYEVDAERYVTEYSYDSFGNQLSLKRYANALAENIFTSSEAAATSTSVSALTAAQIQTSLTADVSRDRTITNVYDLLGRVQETQQTAVDNFDSSATAGNQTFAAAPTTRNTWNSFGQLIKQSILKNPLTNEWIDSLSYYNTRGQKAADINALGYLTTYQYDAAGNLTEQREYAQALSYTSNTPPAAGQYNATSYSPIATTPTNADSISAFGFDRINQFVYDRLNRKVQAVQVGVIYATATYGGTVTTQNQLDNLYSHFTYDAVGNMTSTSEPSTSAGLANRGATSYLYYDALGRTIATAEAARLSERAGNAAMPPLTVTPTYLDIDHLSSANITANPRGAGDPQTYSIRGQNAFDIRWQSLAALGDGNVHYRVDYVARNYDNQTQTQSWEATVGAADAMDGISRTWVASNTTSSAYDMLSSISRVQVWKTVNGVETLIHDTGGDNFTGNVLTWQKTSIEGALATLSYRPRNPANNPNDWSNATVVTTSSGIEARGNVYWVNLSALPADQYEYQLTYTRAGESSPYAKGTGTFLVNSAKATGSQNVSAVVDKRFIDIDFVSSATVTSKPPTSAGEPTTYSISGQNAFNIHWQSLAALGDGNVHYRVDYVARNYNNQTQNQTWENTVAAADAMDGVSSTWVTSSTSSNAYDMLSSIARVQVWKTVNGVEVLMYDTGADQSYPERLILQGNTSGLTGINIAGVGTLSATALGGGFYSVDVSTLAPGVYTYTPNGTASTLGGTFVVNGNGVTSTPVVRENPAFIDIDLISSATVTAKPPTAAGEPTTYSISGQNAFNIHWQSLAALGDGNVHYRVEYVARNLSNQTQIQTWEATVAAADAMDGVSRAWVAGSTDGNAYDMLSSIARVQLWKTVNGVEMLMYDASGDSYNRKLMLSSLPASAGSVTFEYRRVGSSDGYLSKTTSKLGSGWFSTSYDDIANGVYEYRLTVRDAGNNLIDLTALGGTAQGTLTGNIEILRGGQSLPAVAGGSTSTLIPLTVRKLDVFGNVAQQTAYAQGAASANAGGYQVLGVDAANDQTTYTGYDVHGHVIQSIDAEGKQTLTSYDVAGNAMKSWQFKTDADGNSSQVTTLYSYDRLGHQSATTEVDVPHVSLFTTLAPVVSIGYGQINAQQSGPSWGEMQIGVNSGGPYPIYTLNGTQGNFAQVWSNQFAGGGWVTDFSHFIVNGQTYDVRSTLLQGAGYTYYGAPYYVQFWTGQDNTASISWNALSDWGSGNTRATITYTASNGSGQSTTLTRSVEVSDSVTNASFSWGGGNMNPAPQSDYRRLQAITGIKLEKYIDGQWVSIYDSVGSAAQLTWRDNVPVDLRTFDYRPAGTPTWISHAIINRGDNNYMVDLAGIANGQYEYRIQNFRPGETTPSEGQGSFTIAGTASTATSVQNIVPPTVLSRHQASYNAFGEIVSKGLNGGAQEYFDYDQNGRLWRTNDKDGVVKVNLYDLQGRATSEIRSQTEDLAGSAYLKVGDVLAAINRPVPLPLPPAPIAHSLSLNAASSQYLNRTLGTPTDGKKWTFSTWVKRGSISSNQPLISGISSGSIYSELRFNSDNTLRFHQENSASATIVGFNTTAAFSDPSAWYQVTCVYDSANATASDRLIIYVNGVRQSGTFDAGVPLNNASHINESGRATQLFGNTAGPIYFDGYVAGANFIDGQALAASALGETSASTGKWIPKDYTGTYGANGFELNFDEANWPAKDTSGNNQVWTGNNLSATNQVVDTPTDNYCTIDTALAYPGGSTISDGGLKIVSRASGDASFLGTMAMSTPFYYEVKLLTSYQPRIGVFREGATPNFSESSGSGMIFWDGENARLNREGTPLNTLGSPAANGDTLRVACDPANGRIWFGNQNGWFGNGDPATGANPSITGLTAGAYRLFIGDPWGTASMSAQVNTGQRSFVGTPPTGFGLMKISDPQPVVSPGPIAVQRTTTVYDNAGQLVEQRQPDVEIPANIESIGGMLSIDVFSINQTAQQAGPTWGEMQITVNSGGPYTIYALNGIQGNFAQVWSNQVAGGAWVTDYSHFVLSNGQTYDVRGTYSPTGGGFGPPYYASLWNGPDNTASISWNALSDWGSGNIRATITYTASNVSGQTGTLTTSVEVSGSATSASFSWGGGMNPSQADYRRLQAITAIKLEKYIDGQWITIKQTGSPSYTGAALHWPKSAVVNNIVNFQFKPAGSPTWQTAPVIDQGGYYGVDLDGQPQQSYDYLITYTRPGEATPYASSQGSFTLTGSNTSQSFAPTAAQPQQVTPVITQTHDRWGNVLSVSAPHAAGTAANTWKVTSYRYDGLNHVLEEVKPETDIWTAGGVNQRSDGNTANDRPTSHTYYDKSGRAIAQIDPNGNVAGQRYDEAGQLIAEYHADGGQVKTIFDALGRKISAIDANGRRTDYVYDRNNRIVQEKQGVGSSVERTLSYTYDEFGNRITTTNGEGQTSRTFFDNRGNVVGTRLPMGGADAASIYNSYASFDALGHKISEGNGNSDTQSWSYDYFGRLTAHTDLGGATFSYSYNQLGQLLTQTSSRGQSLSYAYYANGQLKTLTDNATHTESYYEYDIAGNHTRERFTKLSSAEVIQDAHLSYDELNRLKRVQDNRIDLNYQYDAVGNRRHTTSTYFDAANVQQSKDYWYQYDKMNRIILSQGVLQNGQIVTTASQGNALAYDANGNRSLASFYESGNLVNESYTFDALNRLVTTNRAGNLTSARTYDRADRLTEYSTYSSPGTLRDRQVSSYNANGWLLQANSYNSSNSLTQQTNYNYADSYDALGNVKKYSISITSGFQFTNTYTKEYAKYDGYKEKVVHGTSSYYSAGDTTETFDVNGNLIRVEDRFATNKNRDFINNSSGQILRKIENGQTEYYYYANGAPIGSSGGTAADFDYNYTPVSASYPGSIPSSYTVNNGDTLQGIAMAVFGDASLWYLIADANGLSGNGDLKVGQSLTIPNQITNVHNNMGTFKVYNPGEIVGDTTPTLPDPPPPPMPAHGGGCGGIGMIIMIIVMIVATVLTAGALAGVAAQGLGAMFSAGMSVLGGTAAAGGIAASIGSFATGLIAGAVGSIVSQGVGIAIGAQDKFSWKQVGIAALTAGIGASGALSSASGAVNEALHITTDIGKGIVNGVVSNVVGQGVGIITGQQKKFDWKGVAAGAISGAAGGMLGKGASWGEKLLVRGTAQGLTNTLYGGSFGKGFAAGAVGVVAESATNWVGDQFNGQDKGGFAHGMAQFVTQGTSEAALAYLNGARGKDVGRAFMAGGTAGFATTVMGDDIRGWAGNDDRAQQWLSGQIGRAIGAGFGNEGAGQSGAMREVTYNYQGDHPVTTKTEPSLMARILRSLGLDNFNLDASVAYYNDSMGAGYAAQEGPWDSYLPEDPEYFKNIAKGRDDSGDTTFSRAPKNKGILIPGVHEAPSLSLGKLDENGKLMASPLDGTRNDRNPDGRSSATYDAQMVTLLDGSQIKALNLKLASAGTFANRQNCNGFTILGGTEKNGNLRVIENHDFNVWLHGPQTLYELRPPTELTGVGDMYVHYGEEKESEHTTVYTTTTPGGQVIVTGAAGTHLEWKYGYDSESKEYKMYLSKTYMQTATNAWPSAKRIEVWKPTMKLIALQMEANALRNSKGWPKK